MFQVSFIFFISFGFPKAFRVIEVKVMFKVPWIIHIHCKYYSFHKSNISINNCGHFPYQEAPELNYSFLYLVMPVRKIQIFSNVIFSKAVAAIIYHIKRSVWLLSAISADLSLRAFDVCFFTSILLHGTVRPCKPINESN